MIAIDKELSSKLANMSFVCTLLVVFIHCQSGGVDFISHFLRRYIPGAFLPMAVPAFFLISGFLLAGSFEQHWWYCRALRKRVSTLLVPYAILNLIYWPLKWAVHTIAIRHFGADAETMGLTWRTPFEILGFPFFHGPAIGPLWYITTLMYFVMISPALCRVISKSRLSAVSTVVLLIIIFAAWRCVCRMVEIPLCVRRFLYFGFSLWGVIFFALGIAFRIWWGGYMPSKGYLWMISCVGVFSALLMEKHGLCNDNVFFIAPTVLCIIGLFAIVPQGRWPSWLTSSSFALFALHVPFLYFFEAMLKLVHCHQFVFTGLGLISEYIFCVVMIIVFINSMRKICPKVVNVCFGGR